MAVLLLWVCKISSLRLANRASADFPRVHFLLGPVEELIDELLSLDAVCLGLHHRLGGLDSLGACLFQTRPQESRQTSPFRHFAASIQRLLLSIFGQKVQVVDHAVCDAFVSDIIHRAVDACILSLQHRPFHTRRIECFVDEPLRKWSWTRRIQ